MSESPVKYTNASADLQNANPCLGVDLASPLPGIMSFAPVEVPSQPEITTMRMALRRYEADADGDPKRKKMIVQDVNRAFCLLPSLADLPANGHSVRFTLKKLSGSKTLQNARSSCRAVLKWANGEIPWQQRSVVLDGEWKTLLSGGDIPNYKGLNLLRFARYCQQRRIAPSDVIDIVVAEFYTWAQRLDTRKDARQMLRAIISGWNTWFNRDTHGSLHKLTLPKISTSPQLTPSLDDLNEEVATEIIAVQVFMDTDPAATKRKRFDRHEASDGGRQTTRKKLSEATIASYGKYLRRGVRILGDDPDRDGETVTLRDIVCPAHMEWVMNTMSDELQSRGKGERALSLMGCAILYVAKYYFVVSDADLAEIHRMYRQVARPEPKMTVKNMARLRALVLEKRHELMRLPALLLNRAIKAIQSGRKTGRLLVDAQVAVAIAILLSIPIREKNLAAILLGEQLTIPGRRVTTGRLKIPAYQVKNGLEIDRLVPVDVAELLRAYIKHVLPLLRSNPESAALFPGLKDNSTRGPACLGTKVSNRIQEHLGIEMNVHLFRHFLAMLHLEEHPGEYEVVRLLLGNRNLDIVKAFYAGAEHDAAHARGNTVIAKLKLQAGLNPNNMLEVTVKPKRRSR